MKTNRRVRFLPIVMLPAILPAVVMPAARPYVPADLLALAMGVSIGLALVGLAWMIKGGRQDGANLSAGCDKVGEIRQPAKR